MNKKMRGGLSCEYLKSIFIYSPTTGSLRWRTDGRNGGNAGSHVGSFGGKKYSNCRYRKFSVDGHAYMVHQAAFCMHNGYWPTKFIDHIDGNVTNNRAANLREATSAQNSQNRGKPENNTSGVKGVSRGETAKRWRAQIGCDNVQYQLGSYATKEEAAEAYKEAAIKLHKSFANLG